MTSSLTIDPSPSIPVPLTLASSGSSAAAVPVVTTSTEGTTAVIVPADNETGTKETVIHVPKKSRFNINPKAIYTAMTMISIAALFVTGLSLLTWTAGLISSNIAALSTMSAGMARQVGEIYILTSTIVPMFSFAFGTVMIIVAASMAQQEAHAKA